MNVEEGKEKLELITRVVSGDSEAEQYINHITEGETDEYTRLVAQSEDLSPTTKQNLIDNIWKVNYKQKPPSIDEFLTPHWLGSLSESLFPWIPKYLTEFFNPQKSYRALFLCPAIGSGKSLATSIAVIYGVVNLLCMRDPRLFFGLSHASNIVFLLASFTQQKVDQILTSKFYEIFRGSDKFLNVKFARDLNKRQKDNPDKICWTSSSLIGRIGFANNINFVVGTDTQSLLGLDIIQGIMTELSFFITEKHANPEVIWNFYNKTVGRIRSRFGSHFLARTIIDSSPNSIQSSPIDQYVFSESSDDGKGVGWENPENLIVTGSQWEFVPKDRFEQWAQTGETFPLFRGSAKHLPKIIEESERKNYRKIEIYNVPIDLKDRAEAGLNEFVKDFCGYPTSSGDFFFNPQAIEDMFTDKLKNIYSFIPANETPNLINRVKEVCCYFDQIQERWVLKREPSKSRFIHCDLSESVDATGISMAHIESVDNRFVAVIDFSVAIVPSKGSSINLTDIVSFLNSLRQLVPIATITFDRYQSSLFISICQKWDIHSKVVSTDTSIDQYGIFRDNVMKKSVMAGRNIVLKNNLKSLQELAVNDRGKRKIDHTKGKVVWTGEENWESSLIGINAKDLSDSVCISANTALASINYQDLSPTTNNENSFEQFLLDNKLKIIHN